MPPRSSQRKRKAGAVELKEQTTPIKNRLNARIKGIANVQAGNKETNLRRSARLKALKVQGAPLKSLEGQRSTQKTRQRSSRIRKAFNDRKGISAATARRAKPVAGKRKERSKEVRQNPVDQSGYSEPHRQNQTVPSEVSRWLEEKMPPKNPGKPNDPPIHLQVEQTKQNSDVGDRRETVSATGTAKSTGIATMSYNDIVRFLSDHNAGLKSTDKDWYKPVIVEAINASRRRRPLSEAKEDLVLLTTQFVEYFSRRRTISSFDRFFEVAEQFQFDLCEKLYELGSNSINTFDFNVDLEQARDLERNQNEFFFQHTVMMHVADHWRRKDNFAYTCNQGWDPKAPTLRRSRKIQNQIITPAPGFRPDLTVSFTEHAMQGDNPERLPSFEDSIMSHYAVSPECVTQCFPFLFVEAKRDGSDIRRASMASFYAACRALNNIYYCMRRAKKAVELFQKARTFSIQINPSSFEARIHRLAWDERHNEPKFVFAVLEEGSKYTRDQITTVIRGIYEYATNVLQPILCDVYRTLLETEGRPCETEGEMQEAWKKFSPTISSLKVEPILKAEQDFVRGKRKADPQSSNPTNKKRGNHLQASQSSNASSDQVIMNGSQASSSMTRETENLRIGGSQQLNRSFETEEVY